MPTTKLELIGDRAMRDAARANLDADIEMIKAEIEQQGIGSRIAETAKDGGRAAADNAGDIAREHTGPVAGGASLVVAGVAAWIFREPIIDALDTWLGRDNADEPAGILEQVRRAAIEKADALSSLGDRK